MYRVLVDLQAGQDAFASGRQTIGGDVSLSISSGLGRNVLTGWLDDFLTEHPATALQVRTDDRPIDVFRRHVDAVVRYGEPEDSSFVTLPLVPDNRRVLCAALVYSARHGMPEIPDDPCQHNRLLLVLSDATHNQWTFHGTSGDGQAHVVRVTGNYITNDGELVRRWVAAGYGIVCKSRLDVLADLRTGRL